MQAMLIPRVRTLIADPAGASQLFDDQEIQDRLDAVRTDLWQALLTPRITFSNPGGMQYLDYYFIPGGSPRAKPRGWFEQGWTLIWGDFTTLTPATSDEIVGHWTFSPSQVPPVMIRGHRYDVYRCAADLLEEKIANLAAKAIDFTSDGQSFHLSQHLTFLERRLKDYRGKQEAITHMTSRIDQVDSAEGSPGIMPRQAALTGSVSADVPFLTGE